jgi:glycosyltransferase involved in cell wall biosynthesis
VTQVYHPDQQATSQLLSALSAALVDQTKIKCDEDKGEQEPNIPIMEEEVQGKHRTTETTQYQASWQVKVLCGYPSNARGDTQSEILASEQHEGVKIHRGGLKIDAKRSLVHRALAYFAFLTWLTYQLLMHTPAHHRVLVVTNPPFAPLIVWGCSKIRRVFGSSYTYFILLHDLYPDGLIALNKLKASSWWVKVWRWFNRNAFSGAQRVITLGRDMSAYCHTTYQLPHHLMTTITNWSPVEWRPDQYRAAHETSLFQHLPNRARQEGMMLVQYSGNMGLWHNIDDLVRTAALVQDAPIHFIMIGEGRRKASAKQLASELKLSNMTWLPFQPIETLTDSLQCAHLSIVSQRPEVLGVMVPSKLYGILASGRAVIAQVPSTSEVAYTVTDHDCGVVLDSSQPELLARLLHKLSSQLSDVIQMGVAARDAYHQHYAYARAVKSFHKLLCESRDQ